MNDVVRIISKSKASIEYNGHTVRYVGGLKLYKKINEFKANHGVDPKKWPVFKPINSDEVLLLHFIQILNGQKVISYQHDELCHCRMISTEDVVSAVRQGCRTIAEVGRATKAGTGCGACHKNILSVIDDLQF